MKILIADEHIIVRAGINKLLKSTGFIKKVEEAGDGREVIKKAKMFNPDLFLLDYDMPRYDAVYTANIIQNKWPDKPILLLTSILPGEHVMESFKAGVNGIVYKNESQNVLFAAIKTVMSGKSWFKGHVAEIIAQEYSSLQTPALKTNSLKTGLLTKREHEMIKYLTDGHTSAEIAEMLFISQKTVEAHKANIYKKTGVNNTVKLLKYALKNKIVTV